MFDKQPLRYHGQEFPCFLAEKGGRSATGCAGAPDASLNGCWEGMATFTSRGSFPHAADTLEAIGPPSRTTPSPRGFGPGLQKQLYLELF